MHGDLSEDFKRAMRRLAATVTVVSCRDEAGRRYGMTATAVTSLCADPPSLLICVNRATAFHVPMAGTGQFCVNLLKVGQENVSAAFGGKKQGDDKFTEGEWLADPEGTPYLAGAQANFFCAHSERLLFGTHTIFIGQVTTVVSDEDVCPLIFQNGEFMRSMALALQ